MLNLRYPFCLDVLKGAPALYRVAEEEDVGAGVGQGTQSVVILLITSVHKRIILVSIKSKSTVSDVKLSLLSTLSIVNFISYSPPPWLLFSFSNI